MSDLNLCQFIGRLGADPETRYMPDGKPVTNLRIAVGESWKDKSGDKQERTEWVSLTAYGKLAEIIAQYLTKGSQAYFAGKMRTRKWTDKEGKDRYTTEVIVDQMQMLGSRQGGERATAKPQAQESSEPEFNDDCPF